MTPQYQVRTTSTDGSAGTGTVVIEATTPEDAERIYAHNEGTSVRAMKNAGLIFHTKEV